MARAKRHHEEGHENSERWLLTYADLITLLMVFFVVMYSMSRADVSKFAKLQAALSNAFRVDVLRGNEPTSVAGDDGATTARSMIQSVMSAPVSPITDVRLVSTIDELRNALLELPQSTQPPGRVQVGPARDGVVISLSGNVLFDSGRADLKPAGLAMLDVVAEKLRTMGNEVRIEGHTDAIAIQTSVYPSNWELSAARAVAVARYLAQFGTIQPERMTAAGFGEYRPAAPNTTREGRARNRRVDLVIVFPSQNSLAAAAGEFNGTAPLSLPAPPNTTGLRPEPEGTR